VTPSRGCRAPTVRLWRAGQRRRSPARPSDHLGQGAFPTSWGAAMGQGAFPTSAVAAATEVPTKLAEMRRANNRARSRRTWVRIGVSFGSRSSSSLGRRLR
jgi:hypothetical protein